MCLLKDAHKTFQKRCSTGVYSPSKLWILLFVSLFPSQYLVAAGYVAHGVYNANVSEDSTQINPMDCARSRRDATAFSTAVTNLQSLSRIASAITLEIGLMDKTLNSQLVLSELLRMGPVKPSDIFNLNPEKVEAFLSQLVELPKTVAETTPPNPVENRLVTLEDMREEAPKFKDFANIPGKEKYEESLKKLKGLEKLKVDIESWKSTVDAMLANLKNSDNEKNTAQRLPVLFGDMEKMEKLSKDFKINSIQDAKIILETSKFINLIVLEKDFRERTQLFTYEDSHVKDVLGNITKVYKSSQTAKSSISPFETIRKIMNSRDARHKQSHSYASGLPLGSTDLSKLSRDIKSDWIKRRINDNEEIMGNLGSAFQHFIGLAKELGDAESSWSPLASNTERVEIGKVLDVNKQIASVPGDYKSFTNTMNALKDCDIPRSYYPADFESVEVLKTNMSNLNEEIKALGDFKDIKFFSNLQIKRHFDTTDLSDQQIKELAKKTFKKLKFDLDIVSFKEKLETLYQDLETTLTAIENIKSLQIDVNVTVEYVFDVMKGDRMKIYPCLENVKTEGFPVRRALEILNNVRNLKLADSTDELFTKVLQSISHLTSAEELAKEFPSFKDVQSTSLKPAGLSHEASQALGLGVQGLSAIQKVFNAQVGLKKSIQQIFKDPEINKLSPEHQKGLKELKKLNKVFNDVDAFMQIFVQASRRKRATGFENAKKIFDDASTIPGAILDFKTLRPAMEQLQKVKTLDDLEKLDLDFSRFEISKAGPHLATLDKFFVEYLKNINAAKEESSKSQKTISINSGMDGFEHFLFDYPAAAYSIIVVSLLLVVAVPIGVFFYFIRKRSKENEKNSPK